MEELIKKFKDFNKKLFGEDREIDPELDELLSQIPGLIIIVVIMIAAVVAVPCILVLFIGLAIICYAIGFLIYYASN